MSKSYSQKVLEKFAKIEDQRVVLLRAAYDLLKKCDEGSYVKNALAVEVEYNGAQGDGFSLMNDIADLLNIDEEPENSASENEGLKEMSLGDLLREALERVKEEE